MATDLTSKMLSTEASTSSTDLESCSTCFELLAELQKWNKKKEIPHTKMINSRKNLHFACKTLTWSSIALYRKLQERTILSE